MPDKLTFRPYIFRALLLILLGWGGLGALLYFTEPTIFPRWGFFALIVIALSATAFPIVYFIATRFDETPPEAYVIVRQAIWVGVFGATLAWLQLARLVTLYVILGLAGGLIAIESVLRLRERARWQPPRVEDHDESA
ncbi:MAG: hypothetical protein HFACDABA_00433 [Anaerolineales bacterium]|nr:hypothetical protein [Anaerolineales bacterium]